ncbi:MAG: MFS transporter [Candidatus Peribacteraceae bacterium]|nr:MFS transporter [Candidatus Peribacteraceae bacterium]
MRVNRTILLLTFSDITVLTGFGLIDPILAIFIAQDIVGGSVFTAGLASSIFLVTKSFAQLPFSLHIDRISDHAKRWWLLAGTICVTVVPFLYIMANHVRMIFLAQFILGIGSGCAYSAWLGLWSRHLDKGHESFEWSLYSTLVGLGTAAAATIGAAIANRYGFHAVMLGAGALSLVGCGILFVLLTNRSPVHKPVPPVPANKIR